MLGMAYFIDGLLFGHSKVALAINGLLFKEKTNVTAGR